jgi:hypothetical protein
VYILHRTGVAACVEFSSLHKPKTLRLLNDLLSFEMLKIIIIYFE